jgi:hypothetical protein
MEVSDGKRSARLVSGSCRGQVSARRVINCGSSLNDVRSAVRVAMMRPTSERSVSSGVVRNNSDTVTVYGCACDRWSVRRLDKHAKDTNRMSICDTS